MKITNTTFATGYCGAYWDISQAEPRTIAYWSNDLLFIELYETAGDAYRELATRSWLKSHPGKTRSEVDKKWVSNQRQSYKGIILSGIYGQSIKTLSERAGLTLEEGSEIWNSFIGQMEEVKKFRDEAIEYAEKYGYIKTILGDKISVDKGRVFTAANNYRVQGFTAVILAAFFMNVIEQGRVHGIDVTSKGVVHDSMTIELPINKLIHMDLICRKYFRNACKKYFKSDYKYDWDLLISQYLHHSSYNYDLDTKIMNVSMYPKYMDYFLDSLADGYDFKIINIEYSQYGKDGLSNFLLHPHGKYHILLDDEDSRQTNSVNLTLQITSELNDIDWWYEPLEDTFMDHVSKFKYFE